MIIKAFQRRFRQSLINGKSDQECLLLSKKFTQIVDKKVEKELESIRLNLPDK